MTLPDQAAALKKLMQEGSAGTTVPGRGFFTIEVFRPTTLATLVKAALAGDQETQRWLVGFTAFLKTPERRSTRLPCLICGSDLIDPPSSLTTWVGIAATGLHAQTFSFSELCEPCAAAPDLKARIKAAYERWLFGGPTQEIPQFTPGRG